MSQEPEITPEKRIDDALLSAAGSIISKEFPIPGKILSSTVDVKKVRENQTKYARWKKDNQEYRAKVKELSHANKYLNAELAHELGQSAIEQADKTLQTPQAALAAMNVLAGANFRSEEIKKAAAESAMTATMYQTTPAEIAKMDLALHGQMEIDKRRTKAAHDLLYTYGKNTHGNGAADPVVNMGQLAKGGRALWRAAATAGINGENGLNFTAALLPELMRSSHHADTKKAMNDAVNGLRALTNPAVAKQIRNKTGIDLDQYASKGKFNGEGGVSGILGFADALGVKGLISVEALRKAGIADPSLAPILAAIAGRSAAIKNKMDKNSHAASLSPLANDLSAMKMSEAGGVKKREMETEQFKLSRIVSELSDEWDHITTRKVDDPLIGMAAWGILSATKNLPGPYKAIPLAAVYGATLMHIASHVTPEDQEKSGQRQISTRFGINAQADMQKLPAINITDTDRKNSTRRQTVGRFGMDLTTSPHDKVRIPNPESVQHAARKFDPALQRQAAGRFGLGETPRSPRLDRAANSAQKAGSTMQNININVNLHGLADKIFSIVTEANTRNARRQ